MGDKVQKSWENFLNPEVLRSNLIVASIYIAAFELLKNAIAERIRYFYTMGFDENGTPTGRKYRPEVLARNDSPVYASLAWLKESQAIDDNDEAVFERVKKLRNELAHALTRMLNIGGLASDLPERFNEMVSLLDKIERWWIVNLEAEAVDPENVIPGAIMGLHLMVGIALGPKEEWKSLFDEFVKRTTRRT